MKLAIVHDFLNQYGGAERVVEALHEVFPDAPIYTSIYLSKNMPDSFKCMDIRTSFMQKFPLLKKHFKKYLILYPKAIESFNLKAYDIILSSSSAFAKGIKKKEICHICYCYTPARFIWNYKKYIQKENFNRIILMLLPYILKQLRNWDLKTNEGVDYFVAISSYIQKRIKRCYGRSSDVIYPPVNTQKGRIINKIADYYLVVSRLNAYKRVDLAINAFNKLNLPLRIIGDGPYRKVLEKTAGPNITFLGKVNDAELTNHYSRCQAFIFPGEEDFGIVPVEAQAFGRPVIAYAAGGALETIIEGITGIFFKEQSVESLITAVKRFIKKKESFNSIEIQKNTQRFDKEIFKQKIYAYVESKYNEFKLNRG